MRRVLATMGAVLLLAACGAGAPQSSSPSATADSPASSTPSSFAPPPVTPTTAPRPTPSAPAATPTAHPATPTEAAVPGKPTGVTFSTEVVELPGPTGTDEVTYQDTHTVAWESPRANGVEIKVYGVTDCLSEPSNPPPGTSGPCLVEHTLLPPAAMVLAGTAPAAAGEISWIAAFPQECGEGVIGADGTVYRAVVVAAYNAVGNSIFAIADSGRWWRADPGDVIC